MKKRIYWLDNIKAIAILLVVVGHTGLENESCTIQRIHDIIYSFHMPLFFILSGYSFSRYKTNKHKVKENIKNYVCIYLIQSLMYIFLNLIFQNVVSTTSILSIYDFCSIIYKPVSHFWYIYTLIASCLLANLLSKVENTYLIMFISLIVSFVGVKTNMGIFSKSIYYFLYFEIGNYCLDITKQNNREKTIFLSMILLITLIFTSYVKIDSINKYYAPYFFSFVIIVVCRIFINGKIKMLGYIGRKSIWIYIFHTYFTSISRNLCYRIIPNQISVTFIIIILSGLVGPIVLSYLFEKIGIDEYITKPYMKINHKNDTI